MFLSFFYHHYHQSDGSSHSSSSIGASTAGEVENKNKKTRKSNKLPTRMVVETAMLAAMTGLSFHLSASFRLETYLGSLFPLPIVVASAPWGDVAAWRTLLVAFLLLTLLSGPLRASNYACLHGFRRPSLGNVLEEKVLLGAKRAYICARSNHWRLFFSRDFLFSYSRKCPSLNGSASLRVD